MPRLAAGDSATSRMANLATRRFTKPVSLVTSLSQIATSSSRITPLRPEDAPILGGNFLGAETMAAFAEQETYPDQPTVLVPSNDADFMVKDNRRETTRNAVSRATRW
jgi:hypothetical protein